ncbi:MAG: aspartyl-tRNA(Asn)/glutamyl-tRNA(Gln) amidotransferase subunit [Hyphomicrobiales bacterium]
MSDIHDLSAVELLARYRAKSLSPSEVFAAIEQHITRWEPHLKALYAYDPDAARQQAAASTERWAKGAPAGPLDGVPVTVKENIASQGVPVPLGTAAMKLVPAAQDAPVPARLREAGAIMFSKTTMPDYGMTSSGVSSFHPLTRNPWDLSKNPGGSSSGAGAAGAAGYGPLHVGTDIGGSVRLPAGWCGLVGLKPSLGRIPVDPPYVGRVAGPMTRSVDDNALMMSVLSRPDPRDGMSLPAQDIDWTNLAANLRGLRIGLLLDAGVGIAVEPEVKAAAERAATFFADQGAIVAPVAPLISREILDGIDRFFRARSWGDIEPLSASERAKIHSYTLKWAEGGATLSGVDAIRGFNQTMELRRLSALLFGTIDYLISPTAPIPAFAADRASPNDDPEHPFEHIAFTVPWNMTEQPAISINAAFTAGGLPIGVQIVGRRFDDIGVLRLAKAWETARGPIANWPKVPS